jgi:hypothetical protein
MRRTLFLSALFAASALSLALPVATPPRVTAAVPPQACGGVKDFTIEGSTVWRQPGGAFFFKAKLAIDADGAPKAYHPAPHSELGLDYLANAGHPGNWWAIVTDNGKSTGQPVVQKETDPAPGFYISTTTLEDTSKDRTDPRRYVDSSTIPFIVLPPRFRSEGVRLGDFAVVINSGSAGHEPVFAIFADSGPSNKLGEGSIALASALGIPSSPKHGGANGGVIYVVFPGSGNQSPRTPDEINSKGRQQFDAWGGMEKLRACFPEVH